MSGNPSMIRHGYCLCLGLSARWDHQQTSDESTAVVLFHPGCSYINAQKRPDIVRLLCALISQLPLFLLSSEYNANLRAINNSQRKLIFSQLQVTSQLGEECLIQILSWKGGPEHQLDLVGTKPAQYKGEAAPQSSGNHNWYRIPTGAQPAVGGFHMNMKQLLIDHKSRIIGKHPSLPFSSLISKLSGFQ